MCRHQWGPILRGDVLESAVDQHRLGVRPVSSFVIGQAGDDGFGDAIENRVVTRRGVEVALDENVAVVGLRVADPEIRSP